MSYPTSARQYVQLFKASVSHCGAISPEDKANIAARPIARANAWLIARGTDRNKELAEEDPAAVEPFALSHGGRLSLEVEVQESGQRQSQSVEIPKYRISIFDLPENSNGLHCLRYDKDSEQRWRANWDGDLDDNPWHPLAHLHINFTADPQANELRLPTGSVCPALLLRAFDYWYCTTIKK